MGKIKLRRTELKCGLDLGKVKALGLIPGWMAKLAGTFPLALEQALTAAVAPSQREYIEVKPHLSVKVVSSKLF